MRFQEICRTIIMNVSDKYRQRTGDRNKNVPKEVISTHYAHKKLTSIKIRGTTSHKDKQNMRQGYLHN